MGFKDFYKIFCLSFKTEIYRLFLEFAFYEGFFLNAVFPHFVNVLSFKFYFCLKQKLESPEFLCGWSIHMGPVSTSKFFWNVNESVSNIVLYPKK